MVAVHYKVLRPGGLDWSYITSDYVTEIMGARYSLAIVDGTVEKYGTEIGLGRK